MGGDEKGVRKGGGVIRKGLKKCRGMKSCF